uniref:Uncharacterized protein n=1 Tax=Romanomermis culicivorax TaxID=13658 RepID=A0A915KP28_ROMCU
MNGSGITAAVELTNGPSPRPVPQARRRHPNNFKTCAT